MQQSSRENFTQISDRANRLNVLLALLPPRARLAAIADTLPVCSAREAETLVDALLAIAEDHFRHGARPPRSGLLRTSDVPLSIEILHVFASCWARFAAPHRRRASACLRGGATLGRWKEAIQAAAASKNAAVRRSGAEAVGDAPWLGAASLAARLLADSAPEVVDGAEAALRSLVDEAIRPGGEVAGDLDGVLIDAVRAYPGHRRRGVLESAALYLTPGRLSSAGRTDGDRRSSLVRWFAGDEDETRGTVRAVIRKSADPRMAARAWEWLGGHGATVAAAAVDRVAASRSPEEREAIVSQAHLLANPARAARVRLLATRSDRGRASAAGLMPGPDEKPLLSPRARLGLPRLAYALQPASAVSGRWSADPDVLVRLAARAAAVEGGAPHRGDRSTPEAERLAARRRLNDDPERVIAELATVGGTDASNGVRGIMLARSLGVCAAIELELLKALAAPAQDHRVERLVATAAIALGEGSGSDSALQALTACLGHPAPRVRANAVEALGRLARRAARAGEDVSPPPLASLIELKEDPAARVRANAIRVLLGAAPEGADPGAEHALSAMLRDERAAHRASGLWLAERVLIARGPGWRRWNQLAAAIADATRADADEAVRARSARIARRVVATVRSDWRERAGPIQGGAA